MPSFIVQFSSQMKELVANLSVSQKISLMVAVSAVLGGIMLTAIWSKEPQFKPLYSDLSGENAAEIASALEEQKIPYKLSADGMSISVPADKVQEVRLTMVGEGALMSGGAGFELFDGKNIGMTEFMQKLNFQRALQGELSRTISQLSEVEQARIHIVMPEESLFREKEKEASASVIVKLKRGRALSRSQINGITQLVANAVEGMEVDGVTIIDSHGNALTRSRSDAANQSASTNMEMQRSFEKDMEKKVSSMLDKAVGRDKSIVRVSVVMDFEHSEKVEETFDPDGVVIRSEQRSVESNTNSEGLPEGVPGIKANLLKGGSETSAKSTSSKKNETINYEVSHVTKKTVTPVGSVEKISVAVLIDGRYETAENGERKYIPRSSEELKRYENLLKRVVGLDPERGDELEVVSVPFEVAGAEVGTVELAGAVEKNLFWISIARNASAALGVILFFVFVIRPLVKWMIAPVESGDTLLLEGGPRTVRDVETALLEEGGAREKSNLIENIHSAAKGNPDMVHSVIKEWIED